MSLHDLADMAHSISGRLSDAADQRAAALSYGSQPANVETRDVQADALADLASLVAELAREVANLAEPIR